MPIYLEEYIRNKISAKTIVICCNDAYFANSFIKNENVLLCTFFGNIISEPDCSEMEYFKYCIEFDDVKEIIIVGHHNCNIMDFLNTNKSSSKYFKKAKNVLAKVNNNPFKRLGLPYSKKLITWLNVIQQMILVSEIKLSSIKTKVSVNITGIVIDESKNLMVEEIDLPIVLSN